MVYFIKGNMFDGEYDVLVNAVNCVGVMGKGLALEFRHRFPTNFIKYKDYCNKEHLRPGEIFVMQDNEQIIINAATKNHWKDKSEEDWVISCIKNIVDWLNSNRYVESVAVPKLGCGLGGLDWTKIRPIMENWFNTCKQDIYIFE